jgi:peptidoglycan/LPS O-acetylase OafA/YrhL
MVLLDHLSPWLGQLLPGPLFGAIPFVTTGYVGVDFFFVLSSFLLFRLYYEKFDLRTHYVRRVFRTFPLYYISLPLMATVTFAFRWTPLVLIYAQNYLYSTFVANPYWTLCVEELFYFAAFPLLVKAFRRGMDPLRFLLASAAVSLAFTYAVSAGSFNGGPWLDYVRFQFPDFLVCYAAGAYLYFRPFRMQKPLALGVLVLADMALTSSNPVVAQVFYPTMMAGAWTIFLAAFMESRTLGGRVLTSLGAVSYGVYIFQYPLIYGLLDGLALPVAELVLLAVVSTLAVATVAHFVVERPFIALGRALSR